MTQSTQATGAEPSIDQDELSIKALARGVLARDFRPRVSSVRRLAEAVLAKEAKPKAGKKKKSAKVGRKKRKLAKIPGQKNSG